MARFNKIWWAIRQLEIELKACVVTDDEAEHRQTALLRLNDVRIAAQSMRTSKHRVRRRVITALERAQKYRTYDLSLSDADGLCYAERQTVRREVLERMKDACVALDYGPVSNWGYLQDTMPETYKALVSKALEIARARLKKNSYNMEQQNYD